MNEAQILSGILSVTDSVLIIFMVIMSIFGVKFYREYSKNRKEKEGFEREERREVAENSKRLAEVLAELKITLEITGQSTNSSFMRVHDRLDSLVTDLAKLISANEDLSEIKTDIKSIFKYITIPDAAAGK